MCIIRIVTKMHVDYFASSKLWLKLKMSCIIFTANATILQQKCVTVYSAHACTACWLINVLHAGLSMSCMHSLYKLYKSVVYM